MCWVNAPPARGPATEATALTPPIEAKNNGLCRRGTMYEITVRAPEKIPYCQKNIDGGNTAPPAPAIARPMMSATDVGERAQINEPTRYI